MTTVHILATCLDRSRYGAVSLLFHTVRRGFPTARLVVYGNGMAPDLAHLTQSCCRAVGAYYLDIPNTPHGTWIEKLVANERDPFWILDTDVVFFEPVQDWFTGRENEVLFAGRREPQFWEDWTKTIHVSRLHPSLMYFNPQLLRAAMRSWPQGQEFLATVECNFFKWQMVALDGKMYFHDTMSGASHALAGTEFTETQNASFSHLFSGSYIHMMPGMEDRVKMHDEIFRHPSAARGLWEHQKRWYEEHKI